MEVNGFSEEIAQIVNTDIVQSETETPFVDADHCAFYATQAALKHFDGIFLAPETREVMFAEREKINKLLKDGGLGLAEAATFALVLPRLKEKNIVPTCLVTSADKSDVIETVLERLGIDIENIPNEEGEAVGVELPALFVNAKNGNPEQFHIWFCEDESVYEREMNNPDHTKNNPDLQAVISLAKTPLDIH